MSCGFHQPLLSELMEYVFSVVSKEMKQPRRTYMIMLIEKSHLYLHGSRDALPVAEDLVEVLCSQDVPERGLSQESGGVVGVLHIGHGHSGVGHTVVHHCIHRHRHRVSCQYLG